MNIDFPIKRRKKLIEGVTGMKSKEIIKSAVNLDKMFNFNYMPRMES